jgi:ankyrin repeat protein
MSTKTIKQFHEAVSESNIKMIKQMIDKYPTLVRSTYDEVRPMYLAIRYHKQDMLELLLQIDHHLARERTGRRTAKPLIVAAEHNNNKAFDTLVTCLGSTVLNQLDAQDSDGWTAMHFAANHGNTVLIERLVSLGSALDYKDLGGRTPMHNTWDPLALELLVRCGSDAFDVKDNFGNTPASRVWRGHWKSLDLLTSFLVLEGSEDRIAEYHEYRKQRGKQPITWTNDDALEIRFRTYFAHSLVYRLLYLSSLSNSHRKH